MRKRRRRRKRKGVRNGNDENESLEEDDVGVRGGGVKGVRGVRGGEGIERREVRGEEVTRLQMKHLTKCILLHQYCGGYKLLLGRRAKYGILFPKRKDFTYFM